MSAVSLEHIKEVKKNARCLHSGRAISKAFDKMATQITKVLEEKNPLVISLMNGGLIASGQLLLRLDFVLQVDFIHAIVNKQQGVHA